VELLSCTKVPGDHHLALRRVSFRVERVRHDAREVVSPLAVHDREVAARVRAAEPERIVLGEHVADHGVTREALADGEPRIG
jgi:hypothetical protein